MPTIGHLIIGIIIPILIYFALNKKYSVEVGLYFLAGSILPDIYTIIKMFIFTDIRKYVSWNITHGIVAWIVWGFIFTIIIFISFRKISKLKFTQIYIILLLAGWLHLTIDMMTQPVRIIGNVHLSFSDFFTTETILCEQDFIIVFYIILIIPIILLTRYIKEIKKGEIKTWD